MSSYPTPPSLEQATQKKRRLLAELDQLTVQRHGLRPEDAKEAILWEQRIIAQKAALQGEVLFLTNWITQQSRAHGSLVGNLKAENAALQAEVANLRAELGKK